jgi:hypothetical protein
LIYNEFTVTTNQSIKTLGGVNIMKIFESKHDSIETKKKIVICNWTIKQIEKRVKPEQVRNEFEKWLIRQIYTGTNNMVIENGCIDFKLFTYDEAMEIRNRIQ